MIDNHLFASLLVGVVDVEKIILVGDKNQLPSVGYGNLYEDLIDSQKFLTTELLQNNRQTTTAGKNSIIDLATAIQSNTIKAFDFENLNNVDFSFENDAKEMLKK
ncbi:AAA family ATPase [Spiroplasma clarkii]|nr:AAA family ATPase [Spiroplasma clarkii]